MNYISHEDLRNLFETSLRLEIIEMKKPESIKKSARLSEKQSDKKIVKAEYKFSPQSELILASLSPYSKKRLARDFQEDDLKNKELFDSIDDPDYIYFNPSENGVYLEYWVCNNIPCPVCNGKLYKYGNPNMPAVDVVCINKHNNGVNYFQIKTSVDTLDFHGCKYFSYAENYVCVGSKRFGYNCHIIRADDEKNKDLLVGYICIKYKESSMNNIRIDVRESFLLLPNLKYKPLTRLQETFTFYNYKSDPKCLDKNIIEINTLMVNKITFLEKYINDDNIKQKINNTINLNIIYDANKIREGQEPPAQLRSMQKYLIMKMKYLNLKNLFVKTT